MAFFGFGKKKDQQNGSAQEYEPFDVDVDADGGIRFDVEEFFRHPKVVKQLKEMQEINEQRLAARQRANQEAGKTE